MEKHLEGLHRQRAGELVVAGGRRQPQPLKSEGEVVADRSQSHFQQLPMLQLTQLPRF
jgi:hypothetical protein